MGPLAPVRRRARRFLAAVRPGPVPGRGVTLAAHLAPAQRRLFLAMQPEDQRHSLEVFDRLVAAGHRDRDLLQAALLHDVGKARAHLRVWHRVVVDLGTTFAPGVLRWLATRGPAGSRRAFEVALRHQELGAADAAAAGCSDRAVALIRGEARAELGPLAEALCRADH